MENSSEPENKSPGRVKMSVLSGRLEMQHKEMDSYLTAARLVRRGWLEEGKTTKYQFKKMRNSTDQPSLSRSEENQARNHAQVLFKYSRTSGAQTPGDKETGSEKKTHEARQADGNAQSAEKPAGRQAGQRDVLWVWASGCRITCRQPRRFKAPVLPAISEM